MLQLPVNQELIQFEEIDYVCVKTPMFSYLRLPGADPILGVEMASTGEVAAFGDNRYEAYLVSLLSTGFSLPKKNILVSIGTTRDKLEFLEAVKYLDTKYNLYATPGTANFLKENNIQCTMLEKPSEKNSTIIDYMKDKKFDLVINIPDTANRYERTAGFQIRRNAINFSIPLIINIKCATLFINSLQRLSNYTIKSWKEYLIQGKRF